MGKLSDAHRGKTVPVPPRIFSRWSFALSRSLLYLLLPARMGATTDKVPLYALGHPFAWEFPKIYRVDFLFMAGFVATMGCVPPHSRPFRSLACAADVFLSAGLRTPCSLPHPTAPHANMSRDRWLVYTAANDLTAK